jgi:hypothetical protein
MTELAPLPNDIVTPDVISPFTVPEMLYVELSLPLLLLFPPPPPPQEATNIRIDKRSSTLFDVIYINLDGNQTLDIGLAAEILHISP